MAKMNSQKGFTLIELLIAVSILGILTAIAVPQYTGYVSSSRKANAINNLRAIYMKQQEYFTNNNTFYGTVVCGNDATAINNALFSGQNIVADSYYTYCITPVSGATFTARATLISDTTTFYTIDNNNVSVGF